MKFTISVLMLVLSGTAFADAKATVPASAESAVEEFALSCFNAVNAKHWLDNAKCYNREHLSEFQRLYLARSGEIAPGVVPQEFTAYYKGDVTLAKLKAIEPAEFFAAFNGGWSILLAPQGTCKNEANVFEVTKVAAAEQNAYRVEGITRARHTCADKTEEQTQAEMVLVRLQDGKPAIEMPQRTFEVLRGGK